MSQTEPNISICIQRSYHWQSRRDSIEPGITESFLICPNFPYEARLIEPGLIDIYYASSLFKEL